MKILLLSDSHFKSIYKLNLEDYDYIFHAGDIKQNDLDYIKLEDNIYVVRGNCDYLSDMPLDRIIILDQKYYLTHSHLFNTKETYSELESYAENIGAKIVIFGHTHQQIYFKRNNIHYINPGSFMEGSYAEIEDGILYFFSKKNIFKSDVYKCTKKIVL